MYLIAEPAHFQETHIEINSAIVSLIASSFPNEELKIYAEHEHIISLKQKAKTKNTNNLSYISFENYNPENKFKWHKKIIGEIIQIWKILWLAKKYKAKQIYFLSLFPTGHLFLKFLLKLGFTHQKCLVVLHGELNYLQKDSPKFSERFLKLSLLKALKINLKYCNYIVLGDSIFNNLSFLSKSILEKIRVLNHPFLYELEKCTRLKNNSTLKICVFGAQCYRYPESIAQFISFLQNQIAEGLVELTIIGGQTQKLTSISEKVWNKIKNKTNSTFVSQKDLETELELQDIAVFLYKVEDYKLCASGALHQALNAGLAIFALKNDYFKATFGNLQLGVLCESIEKLADEINQVVYKKTINLSLYKQDILMFVQQNNLFLQSKNLKALLDSLEA